MKTSIDPELTQVDLQTKNQHIKDGLMYLQAIFRKYKFLLKGKVATARGYDARECQKSSARAISQTPGAILLLVEIAFIITHDYVNVFHIYHNVTILVKEHQILFQNIKIYYKTSRPQMFTKFICDRLFFRKSISVRQKWPVAKSKEVKNSSKKMCCKLLLLLIVSMSDLLL